MAEHHQPPGIDVGPVSAWLEAEIPGARGPFRFELIAGGRSNLTYRVVGADGRPLALRRPPVAHVLPTAHDMAREHKIISALAPTPVPVPAALGLCLDEAVSGAPFYVMDFVEGHILRSPEVVEASFPEDKRAPIGPKLAETLARLHELDVDEIGLGDLAKREDYVARQLRRWGSQFEQMSLPGDPNAPRIRALATALAERIPEQQASGVVHGDFRLDNCVLDDEGAPLAVLDWELCTLGDPLADLAVLLVYWTEPGDTVVALEGQSPTLAAGFSGRAELIDAYAASSPLELGALDYYVAFAYWRLACILQGVHFRYQAGASAGDDSSVDDFPTHIEGLAGAAAAALEGLGR
jgi:aminoglycoside phosphotransferase (APT) family kinase protein